MINCNIVTRTHSLPTLDNMYNNYHNLVKYVKCSSKDLFILRRPSKSVFETKKRPLIIYEVDMKLLLLP